MPIIRCWNGEASPPGAARSISCWMSFSFCQVRLLIIALRFSEWVQCSNYELLRIDSRLFSQGIAHLVIIIGLLDSRAIHNDSRRILNLACNVLPDATVEVSWHQP